MLLLPDRLHLPGDKPRVYLRQVTEQLTIKGTKKTGPRTAKIIPKIFA